MSRQTYAETVNTNKVKAAAIRAHQVELSPRGIDEAFATEMENLVTSIETLNSEQEALKAVQKSKTAELNAALKILKGKSSEADKVIKMVLPKERWIEFGITAKR